MSKGYQLLEAAAPLAKFLANPKTLEVSVLILAWLAAQLSVELKDQLIGAHIEVIRAEYQGAYPALGIHYEREDKEDLGPLVEMKMAELLRSRSILELLQFAQEAKITWRHRADQLMSQ